MWRAWNLAMARAVLAAPVGGWAGDATGIWVIRGELGPKFQHTLVCAFKADSGKLSGPCIGAFGPVLKAGGSLDAASLNFAYDYYLQGRRAHIANAGTVQPDGSVKGIVAQEGLSGAFTAKRR